jgi:hypothetical protein
LQRRGVRFKWIDFTCVGMACVEKGMIAAVGSDVENRRMHRYQKPMGKELVQFIESAPSVEGLDMVYGVVNLEYGRNTLKCNLGGGHLLSSLPRTGALHFGPPLGDPIFLEGYCIESGVTFMKRLPSPALEGGHYSCLSEVR